MKTERSFVSNVIISYIIKLWFIYISHSKDGREYCE